MTTSCQMLTRCMNISHVVGNERASSLLLQLIFYILNTYNGLMWACEM
jgi:hypothetical protein